MYADIAPGYNELHGEEQRRKLNKLLAHVDLSKYRTVLDVGCATTHLRTFFSEQEYTGVDPCKELLEQAPAHVPVMCAPGESLPIADASYDITLSLTALHNYTNPLKGVAELARVTKEVSLIGVLKKSSSHKEIVRAVEDLFVVQETFSDQHDTLILALARRNK